MRGENRLLPAGHGAECEPGMMFGASEDDTSGEAVCVLARLAPDAGRAWSHSIGDRAHIRDDSSGGWGRETQIDRIRRIIS